MPKDIRSDAEKSNDILVKVGSIILDNLEGTYTDALDLIYSHPVVTTGAPSRQKSINEELKEEFTIGIKTILIKVKDILCTIDDPELNNDEKSFIFRLRLDMENKIPPMDNAKIFQIFDKEYKQFDEKGFGLTDALNEAFEKVPNLESKYLNYCIVRIKENPEILSLARVPSALTDLSRSLPPSPLSSAEAAKAAASTAEKTIEKTRSAPAEPGQNTVPNNAHRNARHGSIL